MTLSASWFCPGPPVEEGGGEFWCLYNIYKLAVTTPSVIASSIVGIWTWQKRRKLNNADPRRVRTLADFFDKLVLTLCIIDAVGSLPEYIYVFDTNAYPLKYWDPERGGPVNTILYVEMLEAQVMLNCVAHSYMSFVMWAFIARRRSVARLKRDAPPHKIVAGCLTGLVLYGVFWALMWRHAVVHTTYSHIFIAALTFDLLVFPTAITFMLTMYWFTWRALKRRSTPDAPGSFLSGRYARIRRKLMLITVLIPTTLALGAIGDYVHWYEWLSPKDSRQVSISFVFLRLTACRVIGLWDALIFGGAFDTCLDGRKGSANDKATSNGVEEPSFVVRPWHLNVSNSSYQYHHHHQQQQQQLYAMGGAFGGASGRSTRGGTKKVVVFLTDVDGVYNMDPALPGSRLLPHIHVNQKGEIEIPPPPPSSSSSSSSLPSPSSSALCTDSGSKGDDVTGGMRLKLSTAISIQVDHGGRVPVFISKVGSEASVRACLEGEVGDKATKLCGK
ncbi:hypothetical protein VYU27_007728 [Nannochloropsis oceanica]